MESRMEEESEEEIDKVREQIKGEGKDGGLEENQKVFNRLRIKMKRLNDKMQMEQDIAKFFDRAEDGSFNQE